MTLIYYCWMNRHPHWMLLEKRRVTYLLVSHDQEQVQRMTDRVLHLKEGRLIADGPVEEVFSVTAVD